MVRCLRLMVLLAALGLAASTSPASAGVNAPRGPLRGVVPLRGQVSRLAPTSPAAAPTTNLTYHGGPVMHINTTYAIYWKPPSYPTDFSSTYRPLVNQFLFDVAADSTRRTNVYASDTQYFEATGHVRYSSTYGGSFDDTTSFPPAICLAAPGKPCLTQSQVASEVNAFVTAHRLPRGLGVVYFMLTPPGLVVCDGTDLNGACSDSPNGFCAYHSDLGVGASTTLYAVEPHPDSNGCKPGQSPSNDVAADAQINLVSHEHNEAITDPQGNPGAWYDGTTGQENADKCAWGFGTPLGQTPSGQQYNQLINGRPYWLQREWSNLDTACVQDFPDRQPTATFSASPTPAATGQPVTFNVATVSDPDSDVTGYTWNFGDGGAGSGQSVSHTYSAPGTYGVTLTVHDNDGATLAAGQAMTVGGGSSASSTATATASPMSPQNALTIPTIGFLTSQRTIPATRKGYVSYWLSGTPPGATGRISFATATAIAAARKRKRKLNLGSASFVLARAGRTKVTLRLSRSNLAVLRRKRSLSVKATVTIGSVTRGVTFTLRASR